jgi:hypothetical protein
MTSPTNGPTKGQKPSGHTVISSSPTDDTSGGTDARVPSNKVTAGAVAGRVVGETLSPTEVSALLGIKRTKTWELLKLLKRVPWSTEKRPRYRREDVLRLVNGAGPQLGETPTKGEPRWQRMRKFAHLEELPDGWDDGCSDD